MSLLMRAAVAVYFRRLRVTHRERLPARGPVLLVANHPAMWTDVVVLDVALGRKLHFLAHGPLFRPRVRAALLELHGALPLRSAPEAEGRSNNDTTFARCRELFARGKVVALFPEGLSASDRAVLQLKTGAARLALNHFGAGPEGKGLVVLPAGIHYASRTSFGSEVTVSVGEPIALEPYRVLQRTDSEGAIHALTAHMRQALRGLILDLPEPALAAAVAELEPLAELAQGAGAPELESAQRVAARLDQIRVTEPARFVAIRRRSRAYRRARQRLGLSDRALWWRPRTTPWRQRLGVLGAVCVLGSLPAAAGAALHAVPWAAGELVARHVKSDPARFSFARIASGMVFFPISYALFLFVTIRLLGLPPSLALATLVVMIALGMWTLTYCRYVRALWERFRLLALEQRHPRLVRRAREEQSALLQLLTDAREDGGRDFGVTP